VKRKKRRPEAYHSEKEVSGKGGENDRRYSGSGRAEEYTKSRSQKAEEKSLGGSARGGTWGKAGPKANRVRVMKVAVVISNAASGGRKHPAEKKLK